MGQSEMKKIGTYLKMGLMKFERQNKMPEIEMAKRIDDLSTLGPLTK